MIHFVRVEGATSACTFCEHLTKTTWFYEPPGGGRALLKACDLCVRELGSAARAVKPRPEVTP